MRKTIWKKKVKLCFSWFTIDVNEKEADYHFEFGEEDYEDDYDEEYYDENGEIFKKGILLPRIMKSKECFIRC